VERAAEYGDFGGRLDLRARLRPPAHLPQCVGAARRRINGHAEATAAPWLEAPRPASCEVVSLLPPLMVRVWVEFSNELKHPVLINLQTRLLYRCCS
jgi:hypothetical protein